MKILSKIFCLAIIVLCNISCERNLEDNNVPAIQAVRNGEFFKALQMNAVNNADGTVSIIGINPLERLELKLSRSNAGTYVLSPTSANEARYTFNGTDMFTTALGNGNGTVVLAPGSPVGTVTGTFEFVSYLPGNVDSLYMRRGVIYQVPFGDAPDTGTTPGTQAFTATVDGAVFTPVSVTPILNSGLLSILASRNSAQISITFPENIATGMYAFNSPGVTAFYLSGGVPDIAVSGNLNITAVNPAANTVEGTFSFMTGPPNNINVTNGAFSISY